MIEIISEFVVKEGSTGHFELAFGPGGAWSSLFAASPGFRGTSLLSDTQNLRRYLVVNVWDTVAHWQQALAERQSGFSALEADLSAWTATRTELGIFRMRAEASVRPRGKARRSEAGPTRRRGPQPPR